MEACNKCHGMGVVSKIQNWSMKDREIASETIRNMKASAEKLEAEIDEANGAYRAVKDAYHTSKETTAELEAEIGRLKILVGDALKPCDDCENDST